MLRIVAGSARGLTLLQPTGRGTRPTSGRLREALFSMLEAAEVDFSDVLDLYAGTGALGIEALSRGDGRATFVESDARTCALIRENLDRCKLGERGSVVPAQVGRWRPPAGQTYTLIVADPPYDDAAAWDAVADTVRGSLADDAVVAIEHSARLPAPETFEGIPRWRDRRHGDGVVAIFRRTAIDEPAAQGWSQA